MEGALVGGWGKKCGMLTREKINRSEQGVSVRDWDKERKQAERGAQHADKEIGERTLKKFPSSQSSSWIVLLFQLQLFISFQTISPSSSGNTHSYLPFHLHPSLYLSTLISGVDASQKAREGLRFVCAPLTHTGKWKWTFNVWAKVIQLYKLKSRLGQIGCRVFVVWRV